MSPCPHTELAPRGRRRRIGRLALTPVAALAIGAGVGGFALLGVTPAPAGADAAAAGQLGGFQITASGAGIRTTYEQPNFPLPATPTLEANIGYATAAYNAGPTGSATASTLWPGQVAAGALNQLPLLLQPYFGNTPLQSVLNGIQVGPWPVQATSANPPAPGKPQSANQDSTGVTMESSSTPDAGSATANFGTGSGQNAPAALPSGLVQVQSIGATALGTVQGSAAAASAVSQATAALQGISIAGGVITIGGITTTATSTSDGTTPQVTGSTAISQMTIAGQAVTIDKDGIHVPGTSQNPLGSLFPSVNSVLSNLGITIALAPAVDTLDTSTATAERVLPGLQITIDGTTFDKQLNSVLTTLGLTKVINQIPNIPALPNSQVMVINLGWVDVKSAAAPPFNAGALSTDSGSGSSGDLGSTGATTGSLGDLGSAGTGGSFSPGSAGSLGTTGTSGSGTPGRALAATPVGLFKGLGAGLIALGLFLAGLLAFLLLRADAAVGALAVAPTCAGEELPDL
jgi:hypothetical protein